MKKKKKAPEDLVAKAQRLIEGADALAVATDVCLERSEKEIVHLADFATAEAYRAAERALAWAYRKNDRYNEYIAPECAEKLCDLATRAATFYRRVSKWNARARSAEQDAAYWKKRAGK